MVATLFFLSSPRLGVSAFQQYLLRGPEYPMPWFPHEWLDSRFLRI
ncbi:MAG TPA: hypothetical protein VFC46_13530 [Humisphaera sp.]|nr:hypothetical protein [Humisphaera sp.]